MKLNREVYVRKRVVCMKAAFCDPDLLIVDISARGNSGFVANTIRQKTCCVLFCRWYIFFVVCGADDVYNIISYNIHLQGDTLPSQATGYLGWGDAHIYFSREYHEGVFCGVKP